MFYLKTVIFELLRAAIAYPKPAPEASPADVDVVHEAARANRGAADPAAIDVDAGSPTHRAYAGDPAHFCTHYNFEVLND